MHLYKRLIELPQEIDPEASTFEWESDGKVHLTLHKADAPSYWPKLLTPDMETNVEQKIAMWKTMHEKYDE